MLQHTFTSRESLFGKSKDTKTCIHKQERLPGIYHSIRQTPERSAKW